jgi:ZIP family zinc transporter
MPRAHIAVLLLSFLSVITTSIGVVVAILIRENTKAIAVGIGFSTGIMVAVSTMDLIPEALAHAGLQGTALTVGLGAGVLGLANIIVPHIHLTSEHGLVDTRLVKSVYLVVMGLVIHDVPEGFAMANAYIASPSLGLLVALAIALHNLPEELAMSVPALTLRSKRFLIRTAAVSALAEPAGAIIGLLVVGARPSLNGHFLAFAAGAMIFVSFHELLPMARRYGRISWFVAGFLIGVSGHTLLETATVSTLQPRSALSGPQTTPADSVP